MHRSLDHVIGVRIPASQPQSRSQSLSYRPQPITPTPFQGPRCSADQQFTETKLFQELPRQAWMAHFPSPSTETRLRQFVRRRRRHETQRPASTLRKIDWTKWTATTETGVGSCGMRDEKPERIAAVSSGLRNVVQLLGHFRFSGANPSSSTHHRFGELATVGPLWLVFRARGDNPRDSSRPCLRPSRMLSVRH